MISSTCLCLWPQIGITRFRGRALSASCFRLHGFFHRRTRHSVERFRWRKRGFVVFAYQTDPKIIKSYGYDYEDDGSDDEDDGSDDEDFDSDVNFDSHDILPEEVNNLNAENVKSAKTSSGALTDPYYPERELMLGKGKTNVLPMTEMELARNSASRINPLKLSREQWEKRAFEVIRQQRTRRIAMEKKKTKQKNMHKFSKSEDLDPLTASIAMENKKAEPKIMVKSSRFEVIDPLMGSIAIEKKKAEEKIILKSSMREGVDPLKGRSMTIHSTSAILNEEVKPEKIEDVKYHQMTKRLGCPARCEPLIQYLSKMGFKDAQLVRIYDRQKSVLHTSLAAVQKRLDFLVSVGVKSEDLIKVVTRLPCILEFSIDNNIKPHIEFLLGLGVPSSRLGRIITVSPSLFSCSVERSLKPKVKFLTEEVGLERKNLGKIVVLSPQILTQRVEDSMKSRLDFLSEELGASKESVVKMVTKHPQLLHYSIEDGIHPRIEFLRSIGMSDADIVNVLTRLTQILSLSVERSLRPKYLYLVKELNNGVQSLTANPTYFSLSLEQRIWARHRFLISLNKVPSGPFPLTAFLVADESFCGQWANSTLQEYEAFRKELTLSKSKRRALQKYGVRL